MSREKVGLWLSEMGDFRFDENNTCTLTSEQGITVFVEVPDESEKVFVYSALAPIGDAGNEPLFRYALELNLSLLHTGGPLLALDSQTGTLVLGYSRQIDELNAQTFQNVVGNVALLAEEFAVKIHEFVSEESAAAPSQGEGFTAGGVRA